MRLILVLLSSLLLFSVASAQVERLPEGTPIPYYAGKKMPERSGGLIPYKFKKSTSGLPAIMLAGYWPPTNLMLKKFSDDPNLNPEGWKGGNWKSLGYDIYAFYAEYDTGHPQKGDGDFEVDYQDTSMDFWLKTSEVNPVAIITFGLAYPTNDWELEWRYRNLDEPYWAMDYKIPFKPTPAPPDGTASAGYIRYSSLPIEMIAERVNKELQGSINAYGDYTGDAGNFLCEFIGYHAAWYHNQHNSPMDPNPMIAAGHIHVGSNLSLPVCEKATEETLTALIEYLEGPLYAYDLVLRESTGGTIDFRLNAEASNKGRSYIQLGSMSGTEPGTPLPGGQATLPLNFDLFTVAVIALLNTPVCDNFLGTLDLYGKSASAFNTLSPLPPGTSGLNLYFAYALNLPWDYASNPLTIRVVP